MYMAQLWCKKWNKKITQMIPIVAIFCVFGFFVYARTSDVICSYSSSAYKSLVLSDLKANEDYLQQNYDRNKRWKLVGTNIGATRRLLGGLGSSPPRCTLKCGRCIPCRPVRVMVPPGTPVTNEYYPEAWRCKCGSRLYTP